MISLYKQTFVFDNIYFSSMLKLLSKYKTVHNIYSSFAGQIGYSKVF